VVLIDDSLLSFRLQPDNGILVSPYQVPGNFDTELQRVRSVLEKLLSVEDVRQVLREQFHLRKRIEVRVSKGCLLPARTLQAVQVARAGTARINGTYLPRRGTLKCGRPVYVHAERPLCRILWSERRDCWVIDDGAAKEYTYAAVGRRDEDVPLSAVWTSFDDERKMLPEPLVARAPDILAVEELAWTQEFAMSLEALAAQAGA